MSQNPTDPYADFKAELRRVSTRLYEIEQERDMALRETEQATRAANQLHARVKELEWIRDSLQGNLEKVKQDREAQVQIITSQSVRIVLLEETEALILKRNKNLRDTIDRIYKEASSWQGRIILGQKIIEICKQVIDPIVSDETA